MRRTLNHWNQLSVSIATVLVPFGLFVYYPLESQNSGATTCPQWTCENQSAVI